MVIDSDDENFHVKTPFVTNVNKSKTTSFPPVNRVNSKSPSAQGPQPQGLHFQSSNSDTLTAMYK